MKTIRFKSSGCLLALVVLGTPPSYSQVYISPGTKNLWDKLWEASREQTQPKSKPQPQPKPDTARPGVSISSPASKARLASPDVLLQGTASDNVRVARVEYRVGSGPMLTANGTTSWNAAVRLAPGANTLTVQAVDSSGNRSSLVSRTVTFALASPLALSIVGSGSVSPDLNGRALEVGKSYTLSAKPARGFRFAGWSGVISSTNPRLTFTMSPNLAVEARFIPQ